MAFDGLNFSETTLQYAIKLATESKARLSGIFLDDFLYHSYNIVQLTRKHEASRADLKKLDQKDYELRMQSAAYFEAACAKAHVEHIVHLDKSFAFVELLKESIYSDLLVISADENLSHLKGEHPAPFVTEILADIQCPALVVPRKYKEIEKIILLFDGKPSSVFAIKMFNYMFPWMRKLPTELITVTDPGDSSGFPDDVLIKEFVSCHYPEAKYILLHGDPVEEIVGNLQKVPQNVLIVAGAYRRSPVSRLFKKSMADHLIKEIGEPLFIAHNK